jgi:starvation-inducible DNA-binding protein
VLQSPNRANVPIKTPANLGLDAFLPCERALRQKLLYPERGVQRYLIMRIANSRGRAMLPLKDVLSSRMKTSSHDGRNLAKSNPRRTELLHRREAPLETRTDLTPEATKDISGAMNAILADVFALYLKTKNFHWHMSGHHFRDYHLLLDEHAEQLFAMTDVIAERVRKIGGLTLHSIGEIGRTQRVLDNDADYVEPLDMLAELADDNKTFAARLREAHNVCDEHRDVATASFIEVWIDETERRTWFLFEATRRRN